MTENNNTKTPLPDIILDNIPDLPATSNDEQQSEAQAHSVLPLSLNTHTKPARRNVFSAFHFNDESQKKAGKYLLRFFAMVLIFTLISRGTRAAAMPVVTTAKPHQGEISDKISLTGHVETAGRKDILLPENLLIEEVFAGTGQTVEKGDSLFRLNSGDVDKLIAREENILKELQQKQRQALRANTHDGTALSGAESAANRANADYSAQLESSANNIAAAEGNVAATSAEVERLHSIINSPDASEDEKAAATAQLPAAEAAQADATSMLNEAQQQASTANTAAQRQAEDAARALASAQTQDSEARQSIADNNTLGKITAEGIALDIAEQQEKLDEFYALRGNNYICTAPENGQVYSLPQENTQTTASPSAAISLTANGYTATATATEKQAERINVGDSCDITVNSSSFYGGQMYQGTIKSISAPDENGNAEVQIALPESSWKSGQTVNISFILSKENYYQTIPVDALRSDNGGYYLLAVRQESTVLGTENTVYKIPVTVTMMDSYSAAVEGAVSMNDEIIVTATKPVQEQDRVRVN